MIAGAALIVATTACGGAWAQASYTGKTMGERPPFGGSGEKCLAYEMTMTVTVNGSEVVGNFLQKGRTERNFKATADAKGEFTTVAIVGGGNEIDVKGKLSGDMVDVTLDGYCIFPFKLKKK